MVNVGATSLPAELIFGPRFRGAPHGSSALARCETQMSTPPRPPGRSELMYRLRPSLEIAGWLSLYGELTTGPRFTGTLHGPYAGASSDIISAVSAVGASVLHP